MSHATASGDVSIRSELTVVQVPTDGCAADPNAFSASVVPQLLWRWSIRGKFFDDFETGPRLAAGQFCEYIQTGGLWHGLADGWLVEYQPFTYATGDTLSAPSGATLPSNGAVTTTVTGTAGANDNLVMDDALTPCADTATEVAR